MFCEKYYKKLLNYAKKDQIWADPNCPYRGSLCIAQGRGLSAKFTLFLPSRLVDAKYR